LLIAQSDSDVFDFKWKSFTKAEIFGKGAVMVGTGILGFAAAPFLSSFIAAEGLTAALWIKNINTVKNVI
jgi:hypothetical protein